MISKFQTFQNHFPNQQTPNQNIITSWEFKISKEGQKSTHEPKVLKV
jgi:hypothetical protein